MAIRSGSVPGIIGSGGIFVRSEEVEAIFRDTKEV